MLKTKIRLSVLLLFSLSLALAQPHQGEITDTTKFPLLTGHYQDEYTFDVCTNPGRWQSEPKDLNVSFVTTDKLYFRSEVPDIENKSAAWETSGWRNERLNAQILVWSPDTLKQVRFKISDLKNSRGGVIGKNNISIQLVRYVLSNYPYNESNFGCEPTPYKNVFLMPDRFEAFERFDVPAKTTRPVWLSVNVPASAASGTYTGVVEVQTEKSKPNYK